MTEHEQDTHTERWPGKDRGINGSRTGFSETSIEVLALVPGLEETALFIQQGLTWLSKVKMTNGKSLHVMSKGRIIYHRLESNTTRKRLVDCRDSLATTGLLETESQLAKGGRGKDRQAPTIMCLQHVPSV